MTDKTDTSESAVGNVVAGVEKIPWPPTPPRSTVVSVAGDDPSGGTHVTVASTKQTWRDWMPEGTPEPDRILTRDELVERLRYYNIDADTESIRFWERAGILPRPIRQRRDGATRTTYPDWMIYLVQRIRQLQAEGFSLEQIRPRVRRSAELMLVGKAEGSEQQPATGVVQKVSRPFWQSATGAGDIEFPSELGPVLREMAQRVEVVTGVPSHHINVVIVSEDGGETRITVHLQNESP